MQRRLRANYAEPESCVAPERFRLVLAASDLVSLTVRAMHFGGLWTLFSKILGGSIRSVERG
jgi:hypothetical protein